MKNNFVLLLICITICKITGYIWIEFEVSNENNKDIMKLITVPTGDTFERDGTFIGTLFYNKGKTVQHLYEI